MKGRYCYCLIGHPHCTACMRPIVPLTHGWLLSHAPLIYISCVCAQMTSSSTTLQASAWTTRSTVQLSNAQRAVVRSTYLQSPRGVGLCLPRSMPHRARMFACLPVLSVTTPSSRRRICNHACLLPAHSPSHDFLAWTLPHVTCARVRTSHLQPLPARWQVLQIALVDIIPRKPRSRCWSAAQQI